MSFADARPWAKAIRDEVLSGRMPPWPPRRGVGEFENDRSLSAPAAAILVSWAEGGAPEGNADDLPVGDPVAPPSMDQPADLPILEVRGQRTITQRTIVLSVRPIAAHGESVEVGVVRADGGRQPLVWIPVFDPRRSYTYRLREPIELEPQDRVEVWTPGRGRAELSIKLSDPPSPPSAKPSR